MTDQYVRRATAFFAEYLEIPDTWLWTEGVLKTHCMPWCAASLIEYGAFKDEQDVRRAALRDYSVLLHGGLFGGVK